jgi:hypothetical protein
LLFGDELPQHPQQAGIIDSAVDVAAVVRGKLSENYPRIEEDMKKNRPPKRIPSGVVL